MTSPAITFHYREMTAEGLWVSQPHQVPDNACGETYMRQGVIGGFVSSPRCAVSDTGFFYGLGRNGREIDPPTAFSLGLIEERHLHAGELVNDRLVHEVRLCGYPQYDTAIKACDTRLPMQLGKAEIEALKKLAAWNGQTMPDVRRALLFAKAFDTMSRQHQAALVKLVRRGLVKIYRSFGHNGPVLRIAIEKGAAAC
jgi:hypothetical protein